MVLAVRIDGAKRISDGLAGYVDFWPGSERRRVRRDAVAARADAELGEREAGASDESAPAPSGCIALCSGLSGLIRTRVL